MTPLANRIVKELTLPVRDRSFRDQVGLSPRMGDIHCFDVSDIYELVCDLTEKLVDRQGDILSTCDQELAFLPAPKTWIEWTTPFGREGFLAVDDGGGQTAELVWAVWRKGSDGLFASQPQGREFALPLGSIPECRAADASPAARLLPGETEAQARGWTAFLLTLLACINTPRIIGRRQHMPHRGLEKKLAAAKGIQGKFPLHAWTEILLHVTPPKDASGDPSTEAHLTGKRALHFCRAHLRIWNGRLIKVSAHWRGDASLGIKQSRYKVAA